MDMSSSALLPEIRMEDVDNDDYNYIFSGLLDDTNLPEVDYDPNKFQQKSFKDDDHEFASADRFMMMMMKEDDENTPAMAPDHQLLENVNSQISASSSSSDFLIQSPASFNFVSMIFEEEAMNNDKVDGYTDNNGGSNSVVSNKRNGSSIGRNQTQNKDHILSERKRRHKLSQLFIKLAAMVPDLKKTDKASILAGAIQHMKQLKEKEASLKHQVANIKKKVRNETTSSKEILSSESSLWSTSSTALISPLVVGNIDVKYEGRDILIRINIDNMKKGTIANLIHGMEMNDLTITKSCLFPYNGNSALFITIVAKMDELFSLTANELVTNLHTLF